MRCSGPSIKECRSVEGLGITDQGVGRGIGFVVSGSGLRLEGLGFGGLGFRV